MNIQESINNINELINDTTSKLIQQKNSLLEQDLNLFLSLEAGFKLEHLANRTDPAHYSGWKEKIRVLVRGNIESIQYNDDKEGWIDIVSVETIFEENKIRLVQSRPYIQKLRKETEEYINKIEEAYEKTKSIVTHLG